MAYANSSAQSTLGCTLLALLSLYLFYLFYRGEREKLPGSNRIAFSGNPHHRELSSTTARSSHRPRPISAAIALFGVSCAARSYNHPKARQLSSSHLHRGSCICIYTLALAVKVLMRPSALARSLTRTHVPRIAGGTSRTGHLPRPNPTIAPQSRCVQKRQFQGNHPTVRD